MPPSDAPESTRPTIFQHLLGRGGFCQDPRHAARLRQRSRFPFAVRCGIEQHGNPARLRVETQASAELIAIHHRHEHVGNHQIGGLGLDGGQSLAAIRCLDQPVSLTTQEGDQEVPIRREVVNDQNGGHIQQPVTSPLRIGDDQCQSHTDPVVVGASVESTPRSALPAR